MINAVFRLAFGGRWYVQFVLALLAFGAAGYLYHAAQKDAAEMAVALEQGPPAPVSLNAFDPARDVHAADEVTVTGWFNPAYNYELTEEHRKRSDIVRRMFVFFGPEDTGATRTVRAIVLMPPSDVDRFFNGLAMEYLGHVEGHPLLTLNGRAKTYATLDNMAEDAMKEQGLTKAPGFRYIEIWPASGRAAALAPAPEVPLMVAALPGIPGLLLLLVAGIKFSQRNVRRVAPDPANVAADQRMMQEIRAADSAAFDKFATTGSGTHVAAPAATAAAPLEPGEVPLKGLLKVQTHSNPVYIASPYGRPEGSADATQTEDLRPVVADPVSTLASTPGNAGPIRPAPDLERVPEPAPATRTGPVEVVRGAGRIYSRVKQASVAVVLLGLLYVGSERFGLNDLMGNLNPSFPSASSEGTPDGAGATGGETPAGLAGSSLIPASASLRPDGAVVSAAAPAVAPTAAPDLPAAPTVAASDLLAPVLAEAEPDPLALPAVAPASQAEAPAVALAAAPEAAEAAADIPAPVVTATVGDATAAVAVAADALTEAEVTADPQPAAPATEEASLWSAIPLPGFGNMLLILPVIGAVLLALASLALARGRQAEPPAVFSGRDPWAKLAREARGADGSPA
jgi:hypothetical protein